MSAAEVVREIGFPWFDRHATRGGKEIYQYEHDSGGHAMPVFIAGCHWDSSRTMLDFYRANPPPDYCTIHESQYPGYVADHTFTTWEEAEAWLFAPNKDKGD